MPALLDNGIFSVVGINSAVGAGWKLNFYTQNTTTRINTYPTSGDAVAGTNANSNPITLTATGRIPPVWFADGASPKLVITDSLGVVKETLNITTTSLTSGYVTVEQFVTLNSGNGNWRPAIQGAINYAIANGIQEVRFGATSYDVWVAPKTTDINSNSTDGHALYVTGNIRLKGLPGIQTKLRILNSAGNVRTAGTYSQQTTDAQNWNGAAIKVKPTTSMDFFEVEDLEIDGTFSAWTYGAGGNPSADLTCKGVSVQDVNVDRVEYRNVKWYNFGGELAYFAGSTGIGSIYADNIELYSSPQSLWNAGSLARVTVINPNFHDSYQACETISGDGHTYIGGCMRRCNGASFIGNSSLPAGYGFSYPNRPSTQMPGGILIVGTEFERIPSLQFGSYVRSTGISVIDCTIPIGANTRDVHLEGNAWVDQTTGSQLFSIAGPANTTTQDPSAPAGQYLSSPANIYCRFDIRRTKLAQANSRTIDGIIYSGGLCDNTVVFDLSGEMRQVVAFGSLTGTTTLPKVNVANFTWLGGANGPGGGYQRSISADDAADPFGVAVSYIPAAAGPYNITLTSTYTCADGQRFKVIHNGTNGRVLALRAAGTGLALDRDYYLVNQYDEAELSYNASLAKWQMVAFRSSYAPANMRTVIGTTDTVAANDRTITYNGSATCTVTLPSASAYPQREIMLRTIAAFTVASASSNVVPLVGGAAGTAILAATAGKWARLVSDGTNWQIMGAN